MGRSERHSSFFIHSCILSFFISFFSIPVDMHLGNASRWRDAPSADELATALLRFVLVLVLVLVRFRGCERETTPCSCLPLPLRSDEVLAASPCKTATTPQRRVRGLLAPNSAALFLPSGSVASPGLMAGRFFTRADLSPHKHGLDRELFRLSEHVDVQLSPLPPSSIADEGNAVNTGEEDMEALIVVDAAFRDGVSCKGGVEGGGEDENEDEGEGEDGRGSAGKKPGTRKDGCRVWLTGVSGKLCGEPSGKLV
jgi:hypothetical protein